MRLLWSEQAAHDLEEIGRYVSARNRQAAGPLLRRIVTATTHLVANPFAGRPGRVKGTRELVVGGTAYIVPYRIVRDRCELLAVYHAARVWPETFDP